MSHLTNRRTHLVVLLVALGGGLTAAELPAQEKKDEQPAAPKQDEKNVLTLFNGKNLDGWKVADQNDFEKHGKVEVKNGMLLLQKGNPMTGIAYQGEPPRNNYEITLEAQRIEGGDFFCGITFPINKDYCSLIIGGWGGGVTGLSNVDNMAAVENETTGFTEFKNDRWYAIRLRVTPKHVGVWIDRDQIIDLNTEGRKFSIWWEKEPLRPLGFGTWHTGGALRNIRLRRLID
jgi:hypothetical protein